MSNLLDHNLFTITVIVQSKIKLLNHIRAYPFYLYWNFLATCVVISAVIYKIKCYTLTSSKRKTLFFPLQRRNNTIVNSQESSLSTMTHCVRQLKSHVMTIVWQMAAETLSYNYSYYFRHKIQSRHRFFSYPLSGDGFLRRGQQIWVSLYDCDKHPELNDKLFNFSSPTVINIKWNSTIKTKP